MSGSQLETHSKHNAYQHQSKSLVLPVQKQGDLKKENPTCFPPYTCKIASLAPKRDAAVGSRRHYHPLHSKLHSAAADQKDVPEERSAGVKPGVVPAGMLDASRPTLPSNSNDREEQNLSLTGQHDPIMSGGVISG